jgi:Uma2 family endonuclease
VATTTSKLMTFAEFEQLPDTPQGFPFELRHGELVNMAPPKFEHTQVQSRLRDLLQNAAGDLGVAAIEFGFRLLPEYEYRVADVVFVSNVRRKATNPKGHFQGAPEVVIEVLYPSNTAAEMLDKEKLCLESGCHEFWLVDIDRRQVKVSTPDGHTVTYRSGQEIPLALFNGNRISVDAIFAPVEA